MFCPTCSLFRMQIFKDNRVLLEQSNEEVLQCFVGFPSYRTGHNARYLNFLCQLCVCNGFGIPKSQDIICQNVMDPANQRLLPMKMDDSTGQILIMVPMSYNFVDSMASGAEKQGEMPRLKIVTNKLRNIARFGKPMLTPRGGRGGTTSPIISPRPAETNVSSMALRIPSATGARESKEDESTFDRDTWMDLTTFCATAEPAMVSYFERSLRLLWNLCVGENKACKAQVQPLITREMILAAIGTQAKHTNLPRTIQAQFYSLATHLHLTNPVGAFGLLGIENKVIPWASIQAGTSSSSFLRGSHDMGPDEEKFIDVLKESALDLLSTLHYDFGTRARTTDLAKTVVQMLVQVVVYGQCTKDDLDKILNEILPLLRAEPGRKNPKAVMECQRHMCVLLSSILDQNMDECMTSMLWHYKFILKHYSNSDGTKNSAELHQTILNMAMEKISAHLDDYSLTFPGGSEGCEVLKKHLHVHHTDIVAVLMQLVKSSDTELASSALKILFQIFGFKAEIGRALFKIQLLFDERSEGHYQALCQKGLVLKKMVFNRNRALDPDHCNEVYECLLFFNMMLSRSAKFDLETEEETEKLAARPVSTTFGELCDGKLTKEALLQVWCAVVWCEGSVGAL